MRKSKDSFTTRGPTNEYQARVLEGVAMWAAYYRSNIHRFVEDYLHVSLKLFQIILLVMMDRCATFVFIACRGLGKTFISAIFVVCRCILYPGTKVCISSGTRGQSNNVLEKIMHELVPNSPELANEIDISKTQISSANAIITFRNGSYIKVVTASDSGRGNRAHILLLDEFRMIRKDIIDTILKKFQASPRHPGYLDKPEYSGRADLLERNKTLYLSSAYYQDHWSYVRCKDSCRFMLDENRSNFVCGLPYQLAIQEGLLMEDDVIEQISETDFNEIKWSMEMCAEFWGGTDGSFFKYEAVSKNRKISNVMLPDRIVSKLASATKLRIQPKQLGEIRILSVDVALMASTKHKNDASAVFINQLLPTKTSRYMSNIIYTESHEGLRTEAEALAVRKLFEEFDCDYIALDVKNFGLSVYDALSNEIVDSETGEVYPSLCCCNNDDLAARCADPNIPEERKVIWAILGNTKFNSDCAILLREGFRSGYIRLPIKEYDAEAMMMEEFRGFGALPMQDRLQFMLPYVNTTLLVDELVNLQHEESSGFVRITEKSNMRKDRYSSLSYNYYVALQLEKKIRRDEFRASSYDTDIFNYRAPTRRTERW